MNNMKFINGLVGLRKKIKADIINSANSNFDIEESNELKRAIYLGELSIIRNILNNDSEGIPTQDRISLVRFLDELQKKIIDGDEDNKGFNSNAYINHLYNLSQYIKNETNKQYVLDTANKLKPIFKEDKISAKQIKPVKDLDMVLDSLYTIQEEVFTDKAYKSVIGTAIDIVDQAKISYIINKGTKGISEDELRNFNILISNMYNSYIETGSVAKYREEYYGYLSEFKDKVISEKDKMEIEHEAELIYRILPRKNNNESLEYLVLKRLKNTDKYIVDQEQFKDKTRYEYVIIDKDFDKMKLLSKVINIPVEFEEYIALLDKETDELSVYRRTAMTTACKLKTEQMDIDRIKEDMKGCK